MEVFNKFYTSVTSTVSQLSGVLPGNPVTREFEATQFIATAGPGNIFVLVIVLVLLNMIALSKISLSTLIYLFRVLSKSLK